jgi:ankyrin repeat protein
MTRANFAVVESESLISLMLETDPKVLTVRDNEGFTPLHTVCVHWFAKWCAFYVELACLRYLVTRAPDVLALQDSSGCTLLHLLLRNENLVRPGFASANDAIESLVSFISKANPKVLTLRDNMGFTPLHTACSDGIDSAYSDEIDSACSDGIDSACSDGIDSACSDGIDSACSDGIDSACSDGIAGYPSDIRLIRHLVTRAPDVLALQDSSGRTPLHLLLSNEDVVSRCSHLVSHAESVAIESLISFALKSNPKVLTVRDNEGFTPLLVASQLKLPLNIIYSMLRFDPELNLSSSWFSDSKMCGPIQRKRKRNSRPQD